MGPLQRQNLLGNTKFILLAVALKIADVSRLVRLLFVKIGLGVRVKVNIGWIIDKSWRIRII